MLFKKNSSKISKGLVLQQTRVGLGYGL